MHIFEREVDGRRYRVAAQSVWDSKRKCSVSRQVTLGPVEPAGDADLGVTFTVGTKRVGDVGALAWVAEKLDLVGIINRACGGTSTTGASIGEMALAVAVQRATAPGPKRDLAEFLDGSLPRISCLPADAFSGQAFHRLADNVTNEQLDAAQIEIARAAVKHFKLSTDVLAFDTTNFDTHIATTTGGELAQRGHAKSKRSDLRVVGLGLLVSETGHVPLLHHTYPGNGSDQSVLDACLENLGHLHDALDQGERRKQPAQRTLVRDGGFWSEQLELTLDVVGYYSLISLPMSHRAAEEALVFAARRGSMRPLSGTLSEVRVARLNTSVGELNRTLLVVESKALLDGQKRGIAVALTKAQRELVKLERHVDNKKISRSSLEHRVKKALRREHLATFVVTEIGGTEAAPSFTWRVDAERRLELELKRLGRRVLCTDQHSWSSERIVTAFRGQWNVEELFRRAKGGGIVPWGPSFQWVDSSLRLHTFASVIGLMLVSLVRLALGTEVSTHDMMERLGAIEATLVRTSRTGMGRRPTVHLAPELDSLQRRAVKAFQLERWLPALSSAMSLRKKPGASSTDASTSGRQRTRR